MFERIKILCMENGLTVTELCKEVTGSSGNLPTWKKGNIKSESLCKIADYFDVSVDYLLGRTDIPNSNKNNSNHINVGNVSISDDTKTLVEMIQDLPLLERSKVVVMIDEMRKGA